MSEIENSKQIDNIIKILKEYEECLSDGYKYYCGEDQVNKILKEIAIEIKGNK